MMKTPGLRTTSHKAVHGDVTAMDSSRTIALAGPGHASFRSDIDLPTRSSEPVFRRLIDDFDACKTVAAFPPEARA